MTPPARASLPDDELIAAAGAVLRSNDLGDYTRPSPRLYPHQWNWDSAFAAIGWAHLDWPRAAREIDSLLAAQWSNGMLPHIRYNPDAVDYHPGPEWWPDPPVRRPGVTTSGISQPPVLPSAAYLVGMLQPDERLRLAWWARLFEPLRDMVLYFARHRTVARAPLIAVIHPWESGLDNSPRWDFAVRAGHRPSRPYRRIDSTVVSAAQRPTQADYDLYMYLVEQIASRRYDMGHYLPRAAFVVYDALFNAIWYRAAVELNRIGRSLGRPTAVSEDDLRAFRDAYHTLLWNDGAQIFRDYDVRAAAQIPVDTAAGLVAIYAGATGGEAGSARARPVEAEASDARPVEAGLVDAGQAAAMLARYRQRCSGFRMLPSAPPDQPGFDPARYWRGPVWININWLIARGLDAVGICGEAASLAGETLDLARASGLCEYYHALTGEGLGGSDFSWSAALVIDLLRRPAGLGGRRG